MRHPKQMATQPKLSVDERAGALMFDEESVVANPAHPSSHAVTATSGLGPTDHWFADEPVPGSVSIMFYRSVKITCRL